MAQSNRAASTGANRRYDLIPWAAQDEVHPVIEMARGEGAYLYDAEGKEYLDFSAQLVNVNLGHQHPKVIQAIKDQAERLCYVGPHFTTGVRERLGKLLAEIAPGDIATAYFTGSGSEANEAALTMARLISGRRKVLARYRSYHGTTSGALSVSGDPRRIASAFEHPGTVRFFDPYCYRCSFGQSYPACGVRCAESVEEVIQREGPEQIAALLVEPVTAASGAILPPPEYFAMLRRLCDDYGILMIVDEVITGFGRTGRWFGIEHWDVVPDMMTVSKGLTSGYVPMGAVLMRDHVARHFDESWIPIGSTQSANALACAAGIAAIEAYRDDGLIENAAKMGEVLRQGLATLAQRHACIGDVRALGLLACLELVADPDSREPLTAANGHGEITKTMKGAMLERGLEIRGAQNLILIGPPLCVGEADIARGLDILDGVLGEVDQALASGGRSNGGSH